MIKKGFTLIEILITVGIIAILVGVVVLVISPNTLRGKSRDSQRIKDLASIQTALELYAANSANFGNYPQCGGNVWSDVSCLSSALSPYMGLLPVDPIDDTTSSTPCGTGYGYFYRSDAQSYILAAPMEISVPEGEKCNSLPNWSSFSCSPYNELCFGVSSP